MVGATVLGVFLQGLPPDRRVAMARVASLIRRAARGVRESKRFGLVFYEFNGSPLFALESREKSLTLYVAEQSALEPFAEKLKGMNMTQSLVEFTDLNRLPLPDIEKIIRASVLARRQRETAPSQQDILNMWGVNAEEAAVAPPVVRISMRTAEDEAAEAAAKAEAERVAAESKKILKVTKPEKSLVQKRQLAAAASKSTRSSRAKKTAEQAITATSEELSATETPKRTCRRKTSTATT